jgi:hypothetical protein
MLTANDQTTTPLVFHPSVVVSSWTSTATPAGPRVHCSGMAEVGDGLATQLVLCLGVRTAWEAWKRK